MAIYPGKIGWVRYIWPAGLVVLVVSVGIALSLPSGLSNRTLQIASHVLQVDIAAHEKARRCGLMFRLPLSDDKAMLFVFPQPQRVCMWMKYTFMALSVAFIHSDGTIIDMVDMSPLSLKKYCTRNEVLYALEVRKGWFNDRGINKGMKIKLSQ